MSISTSGVGSGIDIKSLVEQLVEAEGKNKKISFDKNEALALTKITGYDNLKIALKELQQLVSEISVNNPFVQKTATAAPYQNNPIIQANATAQASQGNYSIEVKQLATNQKLSSLPLADQTIGTGTLTFLMGLTSFSFTINSENNSLQQIATTINQTTSVSGVTASLIQSDLGTSIVFEGQTGLNNAFTLTVQDDADSNNTDNSGLSRLASVHLTSLQSAQNAQVNIEGMTVHSASNTLAESISGVEIELMATNIGNPILLTISNDINGVHASVEKFIEKYNHVCQGISQLTHYQDSEHKGILIGDATLRNIQSQLRRTLNNMITSAPNGYQSLAQVGIRTDELTGKLQLSHSDFNSAVQNNPQALSTLLVDKELGVLPKIEKLINHYVAAAGILQIKTDGLAKNIVFLNEQRVSLERHLMQLQSRLLSQFVAMDGIVSRLKSLSEFLTTQLENLPSATFKK